MKIWSKSRKNCQIDIKLDYLGKFFQIEINLNFFQRICQYMAFFSRNITFRYSFNIFLTPAIDYSPHVITLYIPQPDIDQYGLPKAYSKWPFKIWVFNHVDMSLTIYFTFMFILHSYKLSELRYIVHILLLIRQYILRKQTKQYTIYLFQKKCRKFILSVFSAFKIFSEKPFRLLRLHLAF